MRKSKHLESRGTQVVRIITQLSIMSSFTNNADLRDCLVQHLKILMPLKGFAMN